MSSQVISEFPFDAVLANLQFSNSSHSNFEFPLVNSHTSEISKKEAATFLLRVEKKLILKRFSFRHTLSRPLKSNSQAVVGDVLKNEVIKMLISFLGFHL